MSALTGTQLATVSAYLEQEAAGRGSYGTPLITPSIVRCAGLMVRALSDAGAVDADTALSTGAVPSMAGDANDSWWSFSAADAAFDERDNMGPESLRLAALGWLLRLGLIVRGSRELGTTTSVDGISGVAVTQPVSTPVVWLDVNAIGGLVVDAMSAAVEARDGR